jgi:hypothetical protein
MAIYSDEYEDYTHGWNDGTSHRINIACQMIFWLIVLIVGLVVL